MSDEKFELPVTVKLYRNDLIALVKGMPCPYGGSNPLTRYEGNQWDGYWVWDESKLDLLSDANLYHLYFAK